MCPVWCHLYRGIHNPLLASLLSSCVNGNSVCVGGRAGGGGEKKKEEGGRKSRGSSSLKGSLRWRGINFQRGWMHEAKIRSFILSCLPSLCLLILFRTSFCWFLFRYVYELVRCLSVMNLFHCLHYIVRLSKHPFLIALYSNYDGWFVIIPRAKKKKKIKHVLFCVYLTLKLLRFLHIHLCHFQPVVSLSQWLQLHHQLRFTGSEIKKISFPLVVVNLKANYD